MERWQIFIVAAIVYAVGMAIVRTITGIQLTGWRGFIYDLPAYASGALLFYLINRYTVVELA